MNKENYLVLLELLLILFLTACFNSQIDQERIGAEYTVIEGDEDHGSHGSVNGYKTEYNFLCNTIKFDYMNSTESIVFNINPNDTIEVTNEIESGEVWVKITQGDITRSKIQKEHIPNNETITIGLSDWKTGEISIWLVVEEGIKDQISIKVNQY
ncbi:MAG: hypothetical protein ACOWWH_10110 [Eubacteriaceae bacterium]